MAGAGEGVAICGYSEVAKHILGLLLIIYLDGSA